MCQGYVLALYLLGCVYVLCYNIHHSRQLLLTRFNSIDGGDIFSLILLQSTTHVCTGKHVPGVMMVFPFPGAKNQGMKSIYIRDGST
jgi:hypothetical protein